MVEGDGEEEEEDEAKSAGSKNGYEVEAASMARERRAGGGKGAVRPAAPCVRARRSSRSCEVLRARGEGQLEVRRDGERSARGGALCVERGWLARAGRKAPGAVAGERRPAEEARGWQLATARRVEGGKVRRRGRAGRGEGSRRCVRCDKVLWWPFECRRVMEQAEASCARAAQGPHKVDRPPAAADCGESCEQRPLAHARRDSAQLSFSFSRR